ncbi:MAG: ATP-binding cassette domain-containing protein [Flavobacteriia bacterium]
MLEVQKIELAYDRPVLKEISLTIAPGVILGIVGKSGAGKTSLLKIMSGLLEPSSGTVELDGLKVRGPHIKLVPGHPDIQLVNQDFHLDTYHTVEENIREQILYLPLKERDSLVEELLELMELAELRKQKATTLSGGEQQRLALARALACEPRYLLLDEPFVHLDGRLRSKLINYLLELRRIRNTGIVLVSHDGSEMLSLTDAILSMKNGVVTRKGKAFDFYYRPRTIEEAKLFGSVNSVNLSGKRTLFRPDEYEIREAPDNDVLTLKWMRSLFTGPIHENYFETACREKIVLYSFKPLNDVRYIAVKKKK